LTANGKADEAALALMAADREASAESSDREALAGSLEEGLAELWREVLGVSEVHSNSDFFALGGHSLLIGRLVVGAKGRFGAELTLKDVFDGPRLRDMAKLMGVRSGAKMEGEAIPATGRRRLTTEELRSRTTIDTRRRA
jgi:hypothetical protein